MIKLDYVKNKNINLFKDLENLDFEKIQNYIPFYNYYFQLNETNWNNINLNQKYSIINISKKINDNEYIVQLNNNEKINCYFKLSPLIEPDKYLNGNYSDISKNDIYILPKFINDRNKINKYNNNNNTSYIDSFFYFLSSKLKNEYNFIHGVDFYGSFLGLKRDYKYNIADDLEILHHSDYFLNNNGILYNINEDVNKMFNFDTRKHKEHLQISKTLSNLSINSLNDFENFENLFTDNSNNSHIINIDDIKNLDSEYENKLINSSSKKTNNSSTQYDSNTSKTSLSNSDSSFNLSDKNSTNDESIILEEAESEIEESNENYTSCSSSLFNDEYIECNIKKFPVQIICIEKMENTLDYHMNNNEIDIEEWSAIFMQIIMILITYQKVFDFTHNDLHSNNIMFTETDKQFLYYKYNNRYYKVPTFGKIFKIIDFGRAIYKFNGKILVSDSYSENGDAATQYNFPPYYNKNKPKVEPNKSFDLCRLACSLYDNFIYEKDIDDFDNIDHLINDWCKDDNNKNVLYKSNGDERYPGFKLYKMISRKVNKHIPNNELNKPIFSNFKISHKKIKKVKNIMNIDNIPVCI